MEARGREQKNYTMYSVPNNTKPENIQSQNLEVWQEVLKGNLQPFPWVGSADFLLSDFWLEETSLLTRKELLFKWPILSPRGKKKEKF